MCDTVNNDKRKKKLIQFSFQRISIVFILCRNMIAHAECSMIHLKLNFHICINNNRTAQMNSQESEHTYTHVSVLNEYLMQVLNHLNKNDFYFLSLFIIANSYEIVIK